MMTPENFGKKDTKTRLDDTLHNLPQEEHLRWRKVAYHILKDIERKEQKEGKLLTKEEKKEIIRSEASDCDDVSLRKILTEVCNILLERKEKIVPEDVQKKTRSGARKAIQEVKNKYEKRPTELEMLIELYSKMNKGDIDYSVFEEAEKLLLDEESKELKKFLKELQKKQKEKKERQETIEAVEKFLEKMKFLDEMKGKNKSQGTIEALKELLNH